VKTGKMSSKRMPGLGKSGVCVIACRKKLVFSLRSRWMASTSLLESLEAAETEISVLLDVGVDSSLLGVVAWDSGREEP